MKKRLYIIGMAVAISFASCQKENPLVGNTDGDGVVAFSAESITPLSRVTGTSWDNGDAIGITMVSSNSAIYDNIKYIANTDDDVTVSFTPDTETIYYLEDGSAVNFYAFYPYQNSWSWSDSGMILDISDQDGTQDAQSKVDLLMSVITDQTEGEQKFQFKHALSKVQITVSNYADESSAFEDLSNLTATISAKNTRYNAFTSERVSSDETMNLEMVKTTVGDDKAIFTAILAPGEVSDNIIFTDGTYNYNATLAFTAQAGYLYTFTATVGELGSTLILSSDDVTDWEGEADSTLSKVIELVDGVYQVYTAQGLKLFADLVNNGSNGINGKLMADIELSGTWTPIGYGESETTSYIGTFDGDGHSISGLYVSGGTSNGQALFSAVVGGTVKNLTVSGEVTSSKNNAAGIAGYAYGATFENCHNNAKVTGTKYAAGIVGYCSVSAITTITNCSNTGIIYCSGDFAGGIVGKMFGKSGVVSTMTNCANSGYVSGASQYVGGLAGANQGGAIYNSYNLGEVKSSSSEVGGLVGIHEQYNSYGAVMNNCYTSAAVTGSSNVGLAVGKNDTATITNCYYDSSRSGSAIGTDNYSQSVTAYSSLSALLTSLNNIASNYTSYDAWVEGSESYPTLSFLTE